MKTISWLHISDWHQKGEDFDRTVILDALLKDIKERHKISSALQKIDFIFFTGDIAFSGKTNEYDLAVEKLIEPIFKSLGVPKSVGWKSTFVIPGNHDFDRSEFENISEQFKIEIKNAQGVNTALLNNGIKPALLSPFKNYSTFIKKYFKSQYKNEDPAFSYLRAKQIDNKKIGILGLNSAWHCSRQHNKNGDIYDYGNLIIGEAQIHNLLHESGNCDILIALTHHPFNWLNDFDRDLIEEQLTRHCHFILHGHQHLPRVNILNSTLGDTIIIPGGASYDRRKPEDPRYTNSYNFVSLNLENGNGEVFLRKWSEQQGAWREDSDIITNGVYSFSITKDRILKHPEKVEARKKVLERFNYPLKKRFFDKMHLSIKHSIVEIDGIKLIKHEMFYDFKIGSGLPEDFTWETFSDDRVSKLIIDKSLNINAYNLEYFKVDGKYLEPKSKNEQKILFNFQISKEIVEVEYKYILYLRSDDIYKFHLYRFAHYFKLNFQGEKNVRYNFLPIGGFPNLTPKGHPVYDYHELELDGLCFPDQGYLIQWYSPD